jgi:deoxyribonuclease V
MDIERLKLEQTELAEKVVINTKFRKIRLIAGSELLGTPNGEFICSVVVLDYDTMKLVDSAIHVGPLGMKYIPEFMGFSQGPLILNAYLKLKEKPDLLMVKGNGIAHPRRIGLASQLGLQIGIPTIGVTTKLLCGKLHEHKIIVDGETRGVEIPTREFSNPIFVSPGHLISINKAAEIVKHCIIPPHKLPEPIFIAHKMANKYKKKE